MVRLKSMVRDLTFGHEIDHKKKGLKLSKKNILKTRFYNHLLRRDQGRQKKKASWSISYENYFDKTSNTCGSQFSFQNQPKYFQKSSK